MPDSSSGINVEMLRDRVRAGAELLDERVPGWKDQLSLAELDVSNCGACVLGQLFGEYDVGIDELEADIYGKGRRAHHVGFLATIEPAAAMRVEEFPVLTELWIGFVKGEWS